MQPAATAEELDESERQLGFGLPTELRALYGLCREAGPLMTFDLYSPEFMVAETENITDLLSELASEGLLTTDPWDPEDRFWVGDPPQGNYIVFGSFSPGILAIETNGPLAGQIRFLGFNSEVDHRWCREAWSLEGFLELQLEIAQHNLVHAMQYANNTDAHAHRDAGVVEDGDMIIMSREEAYDYEADDLVEPYLTTVVTLTAKYGGTGAFFFSHYPEPERPI